MAIFDAQEHDPRVDQRKRTVAFAIVLAILALSAFWFWPSGRVRFFSEWRIASRFLRALEDKNFDNAYGIYNSDLNWHQHPDKYSQYPLSQFLQDWGPASEFGNINSFHIYCAIEPPNSGFASATGIVVLATVNHRPEPVLLWVEKKSHTISTSPRDLEFLTRHSPLVRAMCYRPGEQVR